jgi:FKBP-type peptidyl-prolyl cis-trans isomerase
MKIPKSLRITDTKIGDGKIAEKGKWALISYSCFLPQGDLVDKRSNAKIVAGSRDVIPAIGYGILGMAAGGIREITASPNMIYVEKRIYPSLSINATLKYQVEILDVAESYEALIEPKI